MNNIIIIILLIGCSKISLIDKNKEYEELSLSINELIISAIHDNDLYLFDLYIPKIENINSYIGDRGNLLHAASEIGDINIVRKLLELGADPLIKNSYGKYAHEISFNKDINDIISDYVIRKEIIIAFNNKEEDIIKILLSKNKEILLLKVKNISLLEELCSILNWKENRDIFNLIIELLKDDFEKTIYVKKRIVEKGSNEIETREELNEYINMLEKLKRIDNNYFPSRNFINNYIKIALRKGYVSEFNILVKLENKQNIAMALLDEFLENSSAFLESFSHNFNFINDIFKKLNLEDVIKKLDKRNNLKGKVWNFLVENPNIDINKIFKFYNLFIKGMEFKFNKSVNSLYIKGKEKEIKLFLTYHLTDLILSPIISGHLFLYCANKNYEDIVEYLVHKELVIKDTRILQNYIIEKNLIEKLIERNFKKAIKKLLEVVAERIIKEEIILDYSFKNFNEELIYLLKKRGSKFNNGEYLKAAIENQNFNIVKLVLEDFKDIDYINRENLLIKAFEGAGIEIVELLIERGANISVKNEDGYTPLMYAAEKGYTEIVEILLKKVANINYKDNQWPTLLIKSSYYDAKIDGCIALMLASQNGHIEVVKLLIEKGANINREDADGSTALIFALKKGHKEIVKLLIEKGANISVKNKDGYTPLMYAAEKGYTEIVELLLEGLKISFKKKVIKK